MLKDFSFPGYVIGLLVSGLSKGRQKKRHFLWSAADGRLKPSPRLTGYLTPLVTRQKWFRDCLPHPDMHGARNPILHTARTVESTLTLVVLRVAIFAQR